MTATEIDALSPPELNEAVYRFIYPEWDPWYYPDYCNDLTAREDLKQRIIAKGWYPSTGQMWTHIAGAKGDHEWRAIIRVIDRSKKVPDSVFGSTPEMRSYEAQHESEGVALARAFLKSCEESKETG